MQRKGQKTRKKGGGKHESKKDQCSSKRYKNFYTIEKKWGGREPEGVPQVSIEEAIEGASLKKKKYPPVNGSPYRDFNLGIGRGARQWR